MDGNMAISRQRYLFDGPGTYYIDLAASCSVQERKLHRQMKRYHVMGGLIKDRNNESTIEINTAPDTWVTTTAVKRGKRIFDKMVKKNTETAGIVKARWHDFRVSLCEDMDVDFFPQGSNEHSNVKLPLDAAGMDLYGAASKPELEFSQYHTEDIAWSTESLDGSDNRNADSFRPMITGIHKEGTGEEGNIWSRISLIQSWFESRNPPDQDTPLTDVVALDDPLLNLFDVSDVLDEVVEDLAQQGDFPPYDMFGHFGGIHDAQSEFTTFWDSTSLMRQDVNLQRQAMAATQSGAGAISQLNGFSAICGLIQVKVEQASPSGLVELVLDVDTVGDEL